MKICKYRFDINEFKTYIEEKYNLYGFDPIHNGNFLTEYLLSKDGTIEDGYWITYRTCYLTDNAIHYFMNKNSSGLVFGVWYDESKRKYD